MFKIQIPKPCKENWDKMQPTQQGAFCTACSKQVVDFTRMTDAEVQHYFLNNSSSKTCGKFKTAQLDRISIYLPENILLQHIAGWKKFMAVIMMAFGSMLCGCSIDTKQDAVLGKTEQTELVHTMDSTVLETLGAPNITTPVSKDSILKKQCIVMGEPAYIEPSAPILMGDTSIMEDSAKKVAQNSLIMGRPLLINSTTKKPVSNTKK